MEKGWETKKEHEPKKHPYLLCVFSLLLVVYSLQKQHNHIECMCLCMSVCQSVCGKERKRERERGVLLGFFFFLALFRSEIHQHATHAIKIWFNSNILSSFFTLHFLFNPHLFYIPLEAFIYFSNISEIPTTSKTIEHNKEKELRDHHPAASLLRYTLP